MDFTVRSEPASLEGTAFIELVPGRFDGRHWQPRSIFVKEDAFVVAEGIIARHYEGYNPLGPNEIPREIGRLVLEDWRSAAIALGDLQVRDAVEMLGVPDAWRVEVGAALSGQRDDIIEMLRRVSAWVEQAYEQTDCVSVLGV